MSSFIDRNPDQMIRYGKDAKEIIGEMIQLIKKVEAAVDKCADQLDAPSQKEIRELHNCTARLLREMTPYANVADDILKKGEQLKQIRDSH